MASIAFGLPIPAVDGNVLRVVARLTGDTGDITKPETKRRMRGALERDPGGRARGLQPGHDGPGSHGLPPQRGAAVRRCPARGFCRALLENRTGELPVKAPKRARRVEARTVYLIFRRGRVALRRRPEKGLLSGLWEYPNEPGGGPGLLEEWGVTPLRLERGGTARHVFTHIEWQMEALIAQAAEDALPEGWVWAGREALRTLYAVPSAFQEFAHLVEEQICE